MNDDKRTMGCFGMVVVILFLGTFAWTVHRFTSIDLAPAVRPAWDLDPGTVTLEDQLAKMVGKPQKITQVRLVDVPTPVEGTWEVESVGADAVVLTGAAGKWFVRCDRLVGFLVVEATSAAPGTPVPQLER